MYVCVCTYAQRLPKHTAYIVCTYVRSMCHFSIHTYYTMHKWHKLNYITNEITFDIIIEKKLFYYVCTYVSMLAYLGIIHYFQHFCKSTESTLGGGGKSSCML